MFFFPLSELCSLGVTGTAPCSLGVTGTTVGDQHRTVLSVSDQHCAVVSVGDQHPNVVKTQGRRACVPLVYGMVLAAGDQVLCTITCSQEN